METMEHTYAGLRAMSNPYGTPHNKLRKMKPKSNEMNFQTID